MREETYKNQMKLMSGLFEGMTKEKYSAYWIILKDMKDNDFERGVKELINNYKYQKTFPSIADIQYYSGVDTESIAKVAINKLKKAAKHSKFTEYTSISFSDKTLNAVVNEFVRWPDLKNWGYEEWNFNYKRLVELYSAYKRQGMQSDKITGLDEERGHKYQIRYINEPGELSTVSDPMQIENKSDINNLIEGIGDE